MLTTTEETKPKKKTKKTTKVPLLLIYLINCPDFCWWKCIICFEYICDFSCLLPQKSESELRSPISLRHQKIPFVAGTVKSVLVLCATLSKCYYSVIPCLQWTLTFHPVNEPEPLSPCQRAKYTSYDEASPAPVVQTNRRSEQIWEWNQEKSPKSLSSVFLKSSWAWHRDRTTTSAIGFSFRPALGSAGRAGTNELVSTFSSIF